MGTASLRPGIGAFSAVRARLLLWVLAVTIPIYAGALYMSRVATAGRLEAGAERDADELAARLAGEMDAVIRLIEGGIRTVAFQLEQIDPPPAQYEQRIRGILAAWPDVYGSTIALEASSDGPSTEPFAPYYFRRGGAIGFSDLAKASYAYREQPWYRRAVDGGKPVWSTPYFDKGGGETWMVTYSVPFFRTLPDGRRVLAGVVTADLDLAWVRKAAAGAPLAPFAAGWLSSPPGTESFVAPIGNTGSRDDSPERSAAVRAAGEAMLARRATFDLLPASAATTTSYLAVRTLATLQWRAMLLVPRAQLLAEANDLLRRQLVWGGLGLALLLAAVSLVAAGIARPLRALAEAVSTSGGEDLGFRLPEVTRRDEIGVLTEALRKLRDSLQDHIRMRAASLAEQARLKHELEIAASIQQSMLPKATSAGALPAAEVAAALVPAREVGGDLYDYFSIRDGQLLFAVGDVSDKGIPAALFMARLSALLRVLAAEGHRPDGLLARINERLAEGNDACMFVTLGCGVLDSSTGRVRYASAGHEPPLERELEGGVRALAAENGAAIGIDAVADYRLGEAFVAPGDTLVLYTDGVTEAEAADASPFGVERLAALLRDAPDGAPAALVQRIVDTVTAHAGGFHATDDITVMAVRFAPPDVEYGVAAGAARWLVRVDVSAAGIARALQRLRGILAARAVAEERIHAVELVAEELLTNIVRAAEGAGDREIVVECALAHAEIVLTVRDDGPAFDPLELEPVDLGAPISERRVGGLGVHIVKELAARCSYARADGCNVLEIRLSREHAA